MNRSRALLGVIALALLPGARQEPERALWTASRLTGSPEPPPPLRADPAFPALRFAKPLHLVPFPGHARYAVVEEDGTIRTFRNDPACDKADLLIDLKKEVRNLDKVEKCKGVQSSYAIAFDPDFARNRSCYVMYVLSSTDRRAPMLDGSRISRFKVVDAEPPRLDPQSEEVIITWRAGGHNGCDLQFGNDGFLYFSTGDAEAPVPPDQLRTGQDVSDLLSSILRIDVRRAEGGRPYAIPADNPFVGVAGVRPEIWSYGFRNPWRMSFDRATGRLWVGDVGWERWEMVICAERGGNYGWSAMEGPDPCIPDVKRGPTPILPPAHALPHTEGTSITGGFVYHGKKLRGFEGKYFYGDWETRRVWAHPVQGVALGARETVARTGLRIVAFAEEADGELLLVDHEGGGLHRLVPGDAGARNAEFPRTLGATGLFSALAAQVPSPGVIPFEVRVPRWADGATARRWIGLTRAETIKLVDKDKEWPKESVWPKDTVFAKTLALDGRKLETQVLHFDGLSWNGYSYVWDEKQADAALAPAEGTTIDLGRGRTWKVPSRAECLSCHNPWAGTSITFNAGQLKDLAFFQKRAILPKEIPKMPPLVDPSDEGAPLDARARSYLHANCAHCHRMGGGGAAKVDFRHTLKLDELKILAVRPGLGAFDLADPYLVCGGDPARSTLFYRTAKLGQGRMPHLGSDSVDEAGLRLLARWIASLPASPGDRPERRKAVEPGDVDRLLATTTGALDLLVALETLPEAARAEAVRKALALPPGPVRDLFERFEPPALRRRRLGTTIRPETILSREGDAARGKSLFANPTLQCAKCHRVGAGPETVGPDLAKIAAKLARPLLLESLLEPSKTVDPKFAGVLVQTKGGDVLSGILVSRTDAAIVLRDAEKETRLAAADAQRVVFQKNSLMPDGLLQHLTAQEAADLLAYLESLK